MESELKDTYGEKIEVFIEKLDRVYKAEYKPLLRKEFWKGFLLGTIGTGLVALLVGCSETPKSQNVRTPCNYSVPKDSLDPCAGCYKPEWYNKNDTWTLFNKPYTNNSQDYGKYNMDDGDCPRW